MDVGEQYDEVRALELDRQWRTMDLVEVNPGEVQARATMTANREEGCATESPIKITKDAIGEIDGASEEGILFKV